MLTGPITGIDPFANWSTFRGPSITIPRGLFYGGIFYTSEDYKPPCHISYIAGRDEVCLSTWGIADADGKELAQIYFYDNPEPDNQLSDWGANIGHIIDINGEYSGCLKGRLYHYDDSTVPTATQEPSDLMIFLNNLNGEYTLDSDSLIFDIGVCSSVPKNSKSGAAFSKIELPEGCSCAYDDNGLCYIEKEGEVITVGSVKGLEFVNESDDQVITGEHLTISPYTMPQIVSGGVISGGRGTINYETSVASSSGTEDAIGSDIGIGIVDGGIVIGRRGRLNELTK